MPSKSQRVRLAPFSQKYIDYFNRSKTSKINCLEGSIRSGKTVLNICSFANYIETISFNKCLLIASAKSSSLAWETIAENRGHSAPDGSFGSEDGYGLNAMFRGRCYKTSIKGADGLRIRNIRRKDVYIAFVGGRDRGCIEAVRGLTATGWIATELENHSCDPDNDFIGFMLGRTLGSPHCRIFWDLNPSFPSNRMYTQYLDKYAENLGADFNYLKCNLYDNAALTPAQIEDTLRLYSDKTSVMYQRDILGNRACAEGLIFGMFARNKAPWVITSLEEYREKHFPNYIALGVDFGGNGSNTAFCATLFSDGLKHIMPLVDDEIDMSGNESDVKSFRSRLKDFITLVRAMNVAAIRYIYCDDADSVMVREVTGVVREMHLSDVIEVVGAEKGRIKNRISAKRVLMSCKNWQVFHLAEHVIKSTSSQVWDSRPGHEDQRLDNGSVDIDIADAEEYSWSWCIDELLRYCK